MYAQFEHIIKDSFNYEEALVRQKLKHEDVVLLREKIKRSKIVPRFIHDKTVIDFRHFPQKPKIICDKFFKASSVRERLQR